MMACNNNPGGQVRQAANTLNNDVADILNLHLMLKVADWSFTAYAKNVTDERTSAEAFDFDVTIAARGVNLPRAFGVELRYDF